ncbi:hypothetical protein OG21DRAFT_1399727, partial [Imleria badia]
FNVVFFGQTGAGMSSVINLLIGDQVADVSARMNSCTMDHRPYKLNTGMQQFLIWDTVGFNGMHNVYGYASKHATRLFHKLSQLGGIDLLVFCKKDGRLTPWELDSYMLFEEVLCKGQVPVAVVVTHLEFYDPMEQWWEEN